MAFPITGVLDSFNAGAFQALTARSGWSATVIAAHSWQTDGTPTQAIANLTPGGNMWNTQWANSECWVTMASFGAGPTFDVCGRIQAFSQFGSTYYCVRVTSSTFKLILMNAGGATTLGTYGPGITAAAGDAFGVECIGSQISGYYKPSGGSWSQLLTASDSTITGAGNIGIAHTTSNSLGIDEFGGGAALAPPVPISCDATQAQLAAELSNVGRIIPATQAQLAAASLIKTGVAIPPRRSAIRRA